MESRDVAMETAVAEIDGRHVPVAWARPVDAAPRATVVLLHGLGAAKEAQAPEAAALARAGFEAFVPDAPHHGERRTPLLDAALAAPGVADAHELFLKILREEIAELPSVVAWLAAAGRGPLGVIGISMGAYAALGASFVQARDARLRAVVSILGSPDWAPRCGEPTAQAREWMAEAPVHAPERHLLPPRALLLANAGRDVFVPAARARAFAERLRPAYAAHPERLEYVEYPDSEHFMLERDWHDLWSRSVAWLDRFLPLTA
jgi:uncharacterized protein